MNIPFQPPEGASSNPHPNSALGSPSARIPPFPLDDPKSVPDRYPTTQTITCATCGWKYSQTNGIPETCPACARSRRMADLNAALSSNSDLKKKPAPSPFEVWCDTPEGERCQSGQAYGPYLKQRLHLAFEAGRKAS